MTISVLGISGSPHRHGNTETLLDSFLDGARAAGASVEKVALVDLDYTPCRGCNACHKTGECIVKDEAPALYDRILAADCVAIASPIYSMGITAQPQGVHRPGTVTSGHGSLSSKRWTSPRNTLKNTGAFSSRLRGKTLHTCSTVPSRQFRPSSMERDLTILTILSPTTWTGITE